jgi:hypothetical protein
MKKIILFSVVLSACGNAHAMLSRVMQLATQPAVREQFGQRLKSSRSHAKKRTLATPYEPMSIEEMITDTERLQLCNDAFEAQLKKIITFAEEIKEKQLSREAYLILKLHLKHLLRSIPTKLIVDEVTNSRKFQFTNDQKSEILASILDSGLFSDEVRRRIRNSIFKLKYKNYDHHNLAFLEDKDIARIRTALNNYDMRKNPPSAVGPALALIAAYICLGLVAYENYPTLPTSEYDPHLMLPSKTFSRIVDENTPV